MTNDELIAALRSEIATMQKKIDRSNHFCDVMCKRAAAEAVKAIRVMDRVAELRKETIHGTTN